MFVYKNPMQKKGTVDKASSNQHNQLFGYTKAVEALFIDVLILKCKNREV